MIETTSKIIREPDHDLAQQEALRWMDEQDVSSSADFRHKLGLATQVIMWIMDRYILIEKARGE